MAADLRASPWDVARDTPERLAIVIADTGATRTYGQMISAANRLAHRMISLGLQTGDCIAILMENRPEFVEAVWAAKQIGVYYVCIPVATSAPDALYILENSATRLLITSDQVAVAPSLVKASGEALAATWVAGAAFDGSLSLTEAMEGQPETMVEGRPRGISMLYSSGTTGRPKGIRHRIEDVAPHIAPPRHAYLCATYDYGPQTVFINPGPFYHTAPLRMMLHVQRAGGTAVAFAKFDAEAVLAAIHTYGGTNGMFVPTMFARMLALPEDRRRSYNLGTMRHALHGAAPIAPAMKWKMLDWWGDCICEMYGGTESIGTTTITAAEWRRRPGSVGRPSAITRIRIEGPDGQDCPPGVQGLVLMTQGKAFEYHCDAEKTAEATRPDGWATLGDIGYLDEEGYLFLTDRASNLIISGGVNIYPQEAENTLSGHPQVAEVAVIGLPDEEFGERVHAFVVPADAGCPPDVAGLIAFCRAELGSVKSPRGVSFVTALPRTPLGKIQKKELLRRHLAGELT